MIAIQRIKSMGSRQMKETEQSTSAKRFPNSQIGSDNTSMRRRLAERNDNLVSDDGDFERDCTKSDIIWYFKFKLWYF